MVPKKITGVYMTDDTHQTWRALVALVEREAGGVATMEGVLRPALQASTARVRRRLRARGIDPDEVLRRASGWVNRVGRGRGRRVDNRSWADPSSPAAITGPVDTL